MMLLKVALERSEECPLVSYPSPGSTAFEECRKGH